MRNFIRFTGRAFSAIGGGTAIGAAFATSENAIALLIVAAITSFIISIISWCVESDYERN